MTDSTSLKLWSCRVGPPGVVTVVVAKWKTRITAVCSHWSWLLWVICVAWISLPWDATFANNVQFSRHTVDGAFDGARETPRSVFAADGDGNTDIVGAGDRGAYADFGQISWWENQSRPTVSRGAGSLSALKTSTGWNNTSRAKVSPTGWKTVTCCGSGSRPRCSRLTGARRSGSTVYRRVMRRIGFVTPSSRLWASTAETSQSNTAFGDGEPFPDEIVCEVRGAIWQTTEVVKMEPTDILLLDNHLIQHGRTPYEGTRKHFIALT